jgi:D-aminopeptidase
VLAAIDGATTGPVMEGSIGGGTGMIAYGYKGGTGTASRRVSVRGERNDTDFTIGVLVQANHGIRQWLHVCGRPVGLSLPEKAQGSTERGSIIVVVSRRTDRSGLKDPGHGDHRVWARGERLDLAERGVDLLA